MEKLWKSGKKLSGGGGLFSFLFFPSSQKWIFEDFFVPKHALLYKREPVPLTLFPRDEFKCYISIPFWVFQVVFFIDLSISDAFILSDFITHCNTCCIIKKKNRHVLGLTITPKFLGQNIFLATSFADNSTLSYVLK